MQKQEQRETRLVRLIQGTTSATSIRDSHIVLPVFNCPENLGLIIRSAVAFGIENCHVIGKQQDEQELKRLSCQTYRWIKIHYYSNPSEFLKFIREQEIDLVSIDLTERSIDIEASNYKNNNKVCMAFGNERYGICPELLLHSKEHLHLHMLGPNPSINVHVAASIAMYNWSKK